MSDKRKTWHAEVWELWEWPEHIHRWEIAGGGFVHRDDFVTDEAQKMQCGPLFVYLFRRFGPSEFGSDEHKQIAAWYLTTPNPDVILLVWPCLYGGKYSFGYGINVDRYNNRRDESQKREVVEALQAAITDLATPVAVRDSHINAYGLLPDGLYPECVPYFKYAGYGVNHEWFEVIAYGEEKDD